MSILVKSSVNLSLYPSRATRSHAFSTPRIERPGKPGRMICDNGTEFTRKALFVWSKESGVEPGFIPPGKPTRNAFVESVNGTFGNECLNRHWFRRLKEARLEIDAWRHQYNHVRPHSYTKLFTAGCVCKTRRLA